MLRDGDRTLLEQVLEKVDRPAEVAQLRKLLGPR
jgi:hypothetical protein